jgi:hypothetical protein
VWTLSFLAGLSMVVATAWLVARRFGGSGVTSFFLAVYLVGATEIVVLTLTLSLTRSLRWWAVLAGAGSLLAAAVVWTRRTSPPPVRLREAFGALQASLRDPVVAVLAIAVAVGLVYGAALGLITPPNDWDAMSYHLARSALWIQDGGVGYVEDSPFAPINAYPPNAEIGTLFTLILAHSDRYVGLVQFSALLAGSLATFGIARRIGLARTEALFGALAFMSLPLVQLQSWTALNDLVVASFLATGTYFLLGTTRGDLCLGALSLSLATGTKFTALVALPLVLLVVLAALPRSRRPQAAAAVVAGSALGGYWLVVNLVSTGSLDAGAADVLEQDPDRSPQAVLARTMRLLIHFADSLALRRDALLFLLAGAAAVVAAILFERPSRRRWPLLALGIGGVAALAAAMRYVGDFLLRGYEKLWVELGSPSLAFLEQNRDPHSPSTVFSYYGSLGFLLVGAGIVLGAIAVRRRVAPPVMLALATAPIVFALLFSLAIAYDPFRGRFFLFAMALAASTWGLVLPHRWLAWGATAVAAATVPLSFVHSTEKPLGYSVFEGTFPGVWGKSREAVQTWLRQDGTAGLVDYFAREPTSSRVGLRIRPDDWVYPYFGETLKRDVEFVPEGVVDPSVTWLVVAPGRSVNPRPGWMLALETRDGWQLYRRAPA